MKLIDLLEKYNFRFYRDDCKYEHNRNNSDTIRIYIAEAQWFEFGIDDWCGDFNKMDIIKKVLTKRLLNSEINDIRHNIDMSMIEIFLKEK